MTVPYFTLSSGLKIPAIGYGVGTKWSRRSKEAGSIDEGVVNSLLSAIKVGFRYIDGAQAYATEEEIGDAVKKSGLPRSDFFVVTKAMSLNDPVGQLDESLKKLGTDYVDLYLLHQPFVEDFPGTSLEELWKGLEGLHKAGKAKAIGVSNFAVEHLSKILEIATVKPVVNQIEYSPYLQDQSPGIVEFSKKNGVLLQAYSPLAPVSPKFADGPLLPVLEELSKKYKATPGQLVLKWVYDTGVLPVTTSDKPERQKQALEAFDIDISKEDLAKISEIGAKYHARQYWGHKFE